MTLAMVHYIFFPQQIILSLISYVRVEENLLKEIQKFKFHFKQYESKNYSFQLHIYFETTGNNTNRWIDLNNTWLYDFSRTKYYGSVTSLFHDLPNSYSPVIHQLGVKTYYSLNIHQFYIGTYLSTPDPRRPFQSQFCHKSNLMALNLIRKNVEQAWSIIFNDDVYLNVPIIQTYYEEEILNLPNPYNHLIIRGHCELISSPRGSRNYYITLHGGSGYLVSWLYAYSCDCLSEELMRKETIGSDWEMTHIARSFGISCCETGSPYMIGFTNRFLWKLRGSTFPPCAPIQKQSSSCQPYNYWVNLGKVFIFHWAHEDPYQFPRLMDQYRNGDIYFNILTYYYCNMSTAQEELLRSPQHMNLNFSYNPSLRILYN